MSLSALKVVVAAVHRAELAAVNGQQFTAEEIELAAEENELAMNRLERFEIILPEIGDGLEVGSEFAEEPDDFDIAMAFRFERAGRTDAMEIAVEIELEQRGGIVRRPACVSTTRPGKAEREEIERGDEGIEETDGIIGRNVIVERFGKEQRLGAIDAGAMIHA